MDRSRSRVPEAWPAPFPWKSEHDDGRRSGIAFRPEIRRAARCDRDVLAPAGCIGHDAAAHRSTGVEAIEHIAGGGIEHVEVAGQYTSEHEIASGGRDGRYHRPRR